MKLRKHKTKLIIVAVVLIIVIGGAGWYFCRPACTLVGQIEDWKSYKVDNEVIVGADVCNDKAFTAFLKKTNKGDRQVKTVNGVQLVITPNYDNWSNQDFLNKVKSFCSGGGIYPIAAIKDKLLWSSDCSGGRAVTPNESNYLQEKVRIEACQKSAGEIESYYSTKK